MASLSSNDGGNRRILFKAPDGKRKTLYLGKIPLKQAQLILRHVERLVACQIDGSAPPEETTHWLTGCSDALRAKLAGVGLAAEAKRQDVMTLGKLVELYQSRPGWLNSKLNTQRNSSRALALMLAHFDAETPIRDVTAAAAADYYAALRTARKAGGFGQGIASANLAASIACTLFNYAIDAELLDRNPLKRLPRGARKGNNVMVSEAVSRIVMEEMVGTEDQLLFGLARWGGLRMPSEPRELRWGDVDWEHNRFLVTSPKTERYEGRETRWVPLFPDSQAAPRGALRRG